MEFENGVSTIQNIIDYINDREKLQYRRLYMNGVVYPPEYVITRREFGDRVITASLT